MAVKSEILSVLSLWIPCSALPLLPGTCGSCLPRGLPKAVSAGGDRVGLACRCTLWGEEAGQTKRWNPKGPDKDLFLPTVPLKTDVKPLPGPLEAKSSPFYDVCKRNITKRGYKRQGNVCHVEFCRMNSWTGQKGTYFFSLTFYEVVTFC